VIFQYLLLKKILFFVVFCVCVLMSVSYSWVYPGG